VRHESTFSMSTHIRLVLLSVSPARTERTRKELASSAATSCASQRDARENHADGNWMKQSRWVRRPEPQQRQDSKEEASTVAASSAAANDGDGAPRRLKHFSGGQRLL